MKYFIAGTTITVASLLFHLAFTVDVPDVSTEVARPYVSAFMSFWDGHRAPVGAGSEPVAINRIVLSVAFVWLLGFSRQLPREALFLLRVAFVSAVLSLIFVALSWVPIDRMPLTLLIPHAVWEGYTRERWMEIGRTYDVTQVVTPIDWKLDLPLEIETRWRLYRIPSLTLMR